MGWSNYIVDAKNKIVIEAGKAGIDDIREDLKSWNDLRDRVYEREGVDTSTELVNLTVKDAATLLEAEEMVAGMAGLNTRVLALEYLRLHEVELTADTVIGDDKIHKYEKGYTRI